ncbi:MAG: tRNA (adenosine(37)-N6)-threonylcarbamoyltransferase complex ATPase subunit type 1 TsaE [Campylobacterota bacterium]|nr:tRNA (adenosine(37)-N6)-threonylcarbamoyltransferase complex ATPase subunit type 1 TsaE [Campylobacterota bacterium]
MILNLDQLDIILNKIKIITKDKNIIILLRGTLASGKTTLVKEFVKSLGLNDKVTSPTFSLQSIYSNNIYHYDVYNKTLDQFISLGLLEEFDKDGIHFVEWGDEKLENILKDYGFDVVVVNIEKNRKNESREYIIES